MWAIKSKTNKDEIIFAATEREAYDTQKELGDGYYYEWISDREFMERKTKEWKKQQREKYQ